MGKKKTVVKEGTRNRGSRVVIQALLEEECKAADITLDQLLEKVLDENHANNITNAKNGILKNFREGKAVDRGRIEKICAELGGINADVFCVLPEGIEATEYCKIYADRVRDLINKGQIPLYYKDQLTDVGWYAFQMQDPRLDACPLTNPQQFEALISLARGDDKCLNAEERPQLLDRPGRLPKLVIIEKDWVQFDFELNIRTALGKVWFQRLVLDENATDSQKKWLETVRTNFKAKLSEYMMAEAVYKERARENKPHSPEQVIKADFECRKQFFRPYSTSDQHFAEVYGLSRQLIAKWQSRFPDDFKRAWIDYLAANTSDLQAMDAALDNNPVNVATLNRCLEDCVGRARRKYKELMVADAKEPEAARDLQSDSPVQRP